MKNLILVFATLLVFVSALVAQQQTMTTTATRVMGTEEGRTVIDNLKAGRYRQIERAAAPAFAFTSTGDLRSGFTIHGRNVEPISDDAILVGVKRYPGNQAQYLMPWYVTQDIPEGAVWYPLDEGKRALWNEESGIATYEMIVIQETSFSVFKIEKNYNNYDSYNLARNFVYDGIAVYDSQGKLTIYLFGNFTGNARAIIRNENGWEWAVPAKGISNNQFMVTIDTSFILYFEKYGDNQIGIVDGTGQSDQLTIRIRPFQVSTAKEQQMLLNALIERHRK